MLGIGCGGRCFSCTMKLEQQWPNLTKNSKSKVRNQFRTPYLKESLKTKRMKRTQFKINKINKKDHNHLEAHLGDSEPGRPSLNSVVLNFRSSTCLSISTRLLFSLLCG
ncbi:hypothetical protein Bca4012_003747 [Brassica carinata]